MGELLPGNGDASSHDDGDSQPGGLPDFPPEWGAVIIPDDAAELDEEAARIRSELRREIRRHRTRRMFGVPGAADRSERQPLGVPVVIMVAAVLTTLISLFVVTWDRGPTPPTPITDLGESVKALPQRLAEVTLTDAAGTPVTLGTLLPAVIMIVDDCACVDLVLRTVAAVPEGTTVVVIGHDVPVLAGAPARLRALADPDGILIKKASPTLLHTPGQPPVLFVTASGEVAVALPGARTIDEITTVLDMLSRTTPR